MLTHSRLLLLLFPLVLLLTACDSSEDPNLLNPPPPDSTMVRVVNLVPETIDATLGNIHLAIQLAPFRVSDFRSVLFNERVNFTAIRPGRRDTLVGEGLTQGSRFTYFVLGSDTSTKLIRTSVGTLDETTLAEQGLGRLVFINAIADSGRLYQIRRGCVSGDTLLNLVAFSGSSSTDIAPQTLSLFLFGNNDSLLAATARVTISAGTVTYLIAARENGMIRFYTLSTSPSDLSGALQQAPPEDRTEATVQILNAMSGTNSVSVTTARGETVATGLAPLAISSGASVQACSESRGDSIIVSAPGTDPAVMPIRLTVGSHALVVAYGTQQKPQSVTLFRDVPQPKAGRIYLRGLNVSATISQATIAIGAGAPDSTAEGLRPFGTMKAGMPTGYVELPEGEYPLILRNGVTGGFVMAGLERFTSGYYTVMVVDRDGVPEMVFLREDVPATSLDLLDGPGTLVTFFNLMPEMPASFTIGTLSIDSVAYSYTTSTVLPLGATSISSNAGTAVVDPSSGGYVVGATGSGSNRTLLAFRSPIGEPEAGKTAIRFLNAVPGISDLALFINTVTELPDATLHFGEPTLQTMLDARKYSFIVRRPNDTATVARLDGVDLVANRSYVLVVGPGKQSGSGESTFGTLLLQE